MFRCGILRIQGGANLRCVNRKHEQPPDGEELLTKDELAERLKLTRRGVECLVSRRVLPTLRISRRCVRFSWAAVKAALSKFEVKEVGRR
jgi:excisionase family DNA binding protein